MVLHKFALLGGKVPAATGMRAAGRPPKAGRRTSFAAAAAPPGLRPAGCPPKTLPHRAQRFSACFYGKVFAFCGLCFFADFALFAAGTERIARPPQGQANGSFLATLAACRFLAFAVGKNSPHPRKEKRLDRFYPPSPPVDFGLLRWGGIVPIPARKSNRIVFIHPRRLSILGFAVGRNSPHPRKGKANGWVFYSLSPGSANCGVKSSPSRRRASSRAGCGGRAVK